MNLLDWAAMETITQAMLILLSVALGLTAYRLIRGPTLSDRVVALDVMAVLLVGLIGVYAVQHNEPALLRPAMALALVGFVGTVAFAYYLQRRAAS